MRRMKSQLHHAKGAKVAQEFPRDLRNKFAMCCSCTTSIHISRPLGYEAVISKTGWAAVLFLSIIHCQLRGPAICRSQHNHAVIWMTEIRTTPSKAIDLLHAGANVAARNSVTAFAACGDGRLQKLVGQLRSRARDRAIFSGNFASSPFERSPARSTRTRPPPARAIPTRVKKRMNARDREFTDPAEVVEP